MTTARRVAADSQTVKRHQWLDWGEIVRKLKGGLYKREVSGAT